MSENSSRQDVVLLALKITFPFLFGAIPFGIVFGTLGVNFGFEPWVVLGLSMTVFAGAAQIAGITFASEGSGVLIIYLVTFIINARHLLYGASLGLYLKQMKQHLIPIVGFLMTDQLYAVSIIQFQKEETPHKFWFMFASGMIVYTVWCISTFVGIVIGNQFPDLLEWGVGFVIVAMFTAIIVPQVKSMPMVVATLVAGIAAIIFNGLPNNMGLIVAALGGIVAGLASEILIWDESETQVMPQEESVS